MARTSDITLQELRLDARFGQHLERWASGVEIMPAARKAMLKHWREIERDRRRQAQDGRQAQREQRNEALVELQRLYGISEPSLRLNKRAAAKKITDAFGLYTPAAFRRDQQLVAPLGKPDRALLFRIRMYGAGRDPSFEMIRKIL